MSELKMTQERIAGRALDAEVAERVLGAFWYPTESGSPTEEALTFATGKGDPGWSLVWRYSNGKPKVYKGTLPNYSCDMGSAWLVVEAMTAKGFVFGLASPAKTRDHWVAIVATSDTDRSTERQAAAETPALAICLAALKAIEALDSQRALPSSRPESKT